MNMRVPIQSGPRESKKPKLVYIVHPFRSDPEENRKKIIEICRRIHSERIVPFAPYIAGTFYLSDSDEKQRKMAMDMSRLIFSRSSVDEAWVFGEHISEGMAFEVRIALQKGIPIICKSGAIRRDLMRLVRKRGLAAKTSN